MARINGLLKDGMAHSKITSIDNDNSNDGVWLDHLIAIVEAFRDEHQEFTANQMLTLLLIAKHPNITQRNLMAKLELSDATVSRICAICSERGLGDRGGLELIQAGMVDGDYRARGQSLATKGHKLIKRVRSLMTRE